MRSKLFVPGSRPELFAKALVSEADAISIDLEDSVVDGRKTEARSLVADFLKSPEVLASSKAIIVRVNALGSAHFEADVAAVVQRRLALLNLPKTESPEDIRAAVAAIERAERAHGIDASTKILANIETARGMRLAGEIAAAHERVAGLQLGYADLFEPLGIDRSDRANVHAVMFAVRMAAGATGVFAYDGAFTDVRNTEGLRAEAEMARKLGFVGKSCVHPSQVATINEVFSPSVSEITHAQRVLQASSEAQSRGLGAFVLDGKMLDTPAVRRAQAVMDASRRMGSKP